MAAPSGCSDLAEITSNKISCFDFKGDFIRFFRINRLNIFLPGLCDADGGDYAGEGGGALLGEGAEGGDGGAAVRQRARLVEHHRRHLREPIVTVTISAYDQISAKPVALHSWQKLST